MKKIIDSNNDLIIIALVFVFMIYYTAQYDLTIGGYLISVLLFLLFVLRFVPKHYNFEYNKEKIIIRNSWNPFFYKEYFMKEIKAVRFINALYMGGGIHFTFNNGSKKSYSTSVKRKELEKAIEEIQSFIDEAKNPTGTN
ncbi:hypothetical protein L21SP5_00086 [Salinivirga cyanobacteriivorans]|uniref:DUF304 domain-containing protein n=1 Tax=Salinivirga cyanobacteriivorans TaxID=1307839 RepID=A0A0S2HUM0_9BACT|nr:hypothetical protein [Salinivirga cyanobacteriivorans]ALO13768.1 hypothetical protein L21SP5_00086 [Salinivirga cyanobacteriivorans]